jgi:hypothetical protein
MDLHHADGIAAARTTLALHANPAALQRRLPPAGNWPPTPARTCAAPRCAAPTCWSPSTRSTPPGTERPSRRPAGRAGPVKLHRLVSQARHQATGTLGHLHWWTYTEDPTGVPGKYRDARPAEITRSQTFTNNSAARPRSARPSRRWPAAGRLGCRWPTGRAACWAG